MELEKSLPEHPIIEDLKKRYDYRKFKGYNLRNNYFTINLLVCQKSRKESYVIFLYDEGYVKIKSSYTDVSEKQTYDVFENHLNEFDIEHIHSTRTIKLTKPEVYEMLDVVLVNLDKLINKYKDTILRIEADNIRFEEDYYVYELNTLDFFGKCNEKLNNKDLISWVMKYNKILGRNTYLKLNKKCVEFDDNKIFININISSVLKIIFNIIQSI